MIKNGRSMDGPLFTIQVSPATGDAAPAKTWLVIRNDSVLASENVEAAKPGQPGINADTGTVEQNDGIAVAGFQDEGINTANVDARLTLWKGMLRHSRGPFDEGRLVPARVNRPRFVSSLDEFRLFCL